MRKTLFGILFLTAGTASAQAPAITASGTTLSFGSTPIYVTALPSPSTITLTNSGTAPLMISGISASGLGASDFELSGSCIGSAVTVNVNATCTITASFLSVAAVTRSVTLTVLSNAATNPSITVTGTATVPSTRGLIFGTTVPGKKSLVYGTTNLVFNTVTMGMTSAARQIAIQNNSSQMVTISNVTSSNPEFAVPTPQTCTGTPLAPAVGAMGASSCVIDVTFTPAAPGTTSSGTITITSDAPGSPHKINVSGPGVAADIGAATLAASKLSFPSTPTGTTATILRTTLTNTGNAQLKVDPAAAISGTNKDEFKAGAGSSCMTVGALSPDQSCDLEVDFTPAATGARSASLDVTHDGVGGKSTVALDGTGTTPPPPPTPPAPTTPAPTTPSGTSGQSSGGGGAIDLAGLLLLAPAFLFGRSRRPRSA